MDYDLASKGDVAIRYSGEKMKKRTKWILGTIASLPVLLCIAGFIYFQFFFTIDLDMKGLFDDKPIAKVNLLGWEKLEKGMTKEEVANLLGKSAHQFTRGSEDNNASETWEYNWSIGLPIFREFHPKAYIVRFDSDGKLVFWREPVEREHEKSASKDNGNGE